MTLGIWILLLKKKGFSAFRMLKFHTFFQKNIVKSKNYAIMEVETRKGRARVILKTATCVSKIKQGKIEEMTIKGIAAALGLSASTVSKALNNASDISAETRERVNN
jgi:DNA invertase Pin-like site-specific DNA recombinase